MRFDIITIFPKSLEAIFGESILAKAQEKGLIEINVHDLRDFTDDKRNTVDDRPFGGGPGMLMMVEPIYKCLKHIGVYPRRNESTKVVLTSASGGTWHQGDAVSFAENIDHLVIICGHYEGVDHRVAEHLVDQQISIGNYVLTGGELPAAILVDSIARLLPGVIGNPDSLADESHNTLSSQHEDLDKEYPQFTRPAEFTTEEGENWPVPEVLTSGNHQAIADWKAQNSK